MRYFREILTFAALMSLVGCYALRNSAAKAHTVSPLSFGLAKAKTGEERYDVLYRTHCYAKERGLQVSYDGIGEIRLSVPKGAKSIPLTEYTDFKGTTFILQNYAQKMYVFELVQQQPTKIQVAASTVSTSIATARISIFVPASSSICTISFRRWLALYILRTVSLRILLRC